MPCVQEDFIPTRPARLFACSVHEACTLGLLEALPARTAQLARLHQDRGCYRQKIWTCVKLAVSAAPRTVLWLQSQPQLLPPFSCQDLPLRKRCKPRPQRRRSNSCPPHPLRLRQVLPQLLQPQRLCRLPRRSRQSCNQRFAGMGSWLSTLRRAGVLSDLQFKCFSFQFYS